MEYLLEKFLAFFSRAHPWHNVPVGPQSPDIVNCYIEIVPTDTVKYELDKATGILRVDRPQKYSNYCPALYGFVPQTYCGKRVGDYTSYKLERNGMIGDGDPLDICVLSEKPILKSDILVQAVPIGGFRTIDGDEADDKIIAVLRGDLVYGEMQAIWQCPLNLIERLRHYFLTYKDCPGEIKKRRTEITHLYGREEAHEVIALAQADYQEEFRENYALFQKLQQSIRSNNVEES